MKRIILLIVIVVGLLTGCRDDKYVEVTYMAENTTDVEVTLRISGKNIDKSVTVAPHAKETISNEKGVRGLYMITYLFDRVEVIVGGDIVNTFNYQQREGFFDLNKWEDMAESSHAGGGYEWEDVCTYRITEEDIKACELL